MPGQSKAAGGLRMIDPGPDVDAINEEILELERRLPSLSTDAIAADAVADRLRRRIMGNTFSRIRSGTIGGKYIPDHASCRKLWNVVLGLRRDVPGKSPSAYVRVLRHCRVFSFLAIHSCIWLFDAKAQTAPDVNQTLSLLKMCVLAASICITGVRQLTALDEKDTKLGRIVLDKAPQYKDHIVAILDHCPVDEELARFESKIALEKAQILILETAQLWQEDKGEAAEQLYDQGEVMSAVETLNPLIAQWLAVTIRDIGRGLYRKHEYSTSIVWFDRAYEIMDRLYRSPTALESMKQIRIDLMHSLSMASIASGTPGGCSRAQKILQDLDAQLGEGNLRVGIAHLDLLSAPSVEVFDGNRYSEILLSMIKRFDGSKEVFQYLHGYIQRLHNKSPSLGCEVLDKFLLDLREQDAIEWIEKLVVTRVWLLAHQREAQEGIDAAESVFSKLHVPISKDTAVAAQTLMWKRIEQGCQEKQFATAIRWCRLALCYTFESGGRANRALIERKLIFCAIENGDVETAESAYASMSEPTRDEARTKYLLFKLSVLKEDLAMALDCLQCLGLSPDREDFIYACVLYARNAKALRFTVEALKRLAVIAGHGHLDTVHTPALFRCTVLMLRDTIEKEIRDTNGDSEAVAAAARDLAAVFEGVVEAIESSRNIAKDVAVMPFGIDELEWFCRASYNLSLTYADKLDIRIMACILTSCKKIIGQFPPDSESQVAIDVASKTLNCHFLIASGMSALARKPEASSTEMQIMKDYRIMREHIMAFEKEVRRSMEASQKQEMSPDHISKLSILYVFDFEGAIALREWDELIGICQKATFCNTDIFRTMGDMLLLTAVPITAQYFVSTLRFIVDRLRKADGFGMEKLLKYYHCLFRFALYGDNEIAFQILEELRWTLEGQTTAFEDTNWPRDGIQYLAITAFNEGLCWFERNEGRARQWALLASGLAERSRDGGRLKAQIRQRFATLNVGDLELQDSIEVDVSDEPEAPHTAEECGNEAV